MRIVTFASGSTGNCSLISDGGANILLDAGISARRTESCLADCGLSPRDLCGVLITHEHSDHISGLKMLLKRYDLPVYAPRTVAARLRGMLPDIDDMLNVIPVGRPFKLEGVTVTAFHTPHDTDESVGYRIDGDGSFGIATDMGHVTDEIRGALCGADTVLIESNHDPEMLCYGSYPVYLKRRILSERGHLSNSDCAELAAYLADNGTKKIILGHLSRENNEPEIAMSENGRALAEKGTELYCAPDFGFLELDVKEKGKCFL